MPNFSQYLMRCSRLLAEDNIVNQKVALSMLLRMWH